MNRIGSVFRSPVAASMLNSARTFTTQATKRTAVSTARVSPAQVRAATMAQKPVSTFSTKAAHGFSLVETIKFGPTWMIAYKDALIMAFREVFQCLRPIMAMLMGSTLVKSSFAFSMSKTFLFFFSFIAIFETGYIFLQLYIRQAFLDFFAAP